MRLEKDLWEKNRKALKEFLEYRKQKVEKEKARESLVYCGEDHLFDRDNEFVVKKDFQE